LAMMERMMAGMPEEMRKMHEDNMRHLIENGVPPQMQAIMGEAGQHTNKLLETIRQGLKEAQQPTMPITVRFFGCDLMGTPIALINQAGGIDWAARLDPWGNIQQEYNPHGIEQNIRLPGQYHDRETDLYYNRFRYYDWKIGAYINQDPIGGAGGINLYAYVGGNPANWIDPLGLSGFLTINSSGSNDGSSGSGGLSGHSWISYTPDGGVTTTYGTWGNNPLNLGNGLHENLEIGRIGDATRTAHLDDAAEAKLKQVIDQYKGKGAGGWGLFSPCSTFAADAWNTATGEKLSPYGPYSNPSSLANSINKLNNPINNNEGQSTNPLINSIYSN